MKKKCKHFCEICERYYSCRQSLYKHNKTFHSNLPPKTAKSKDYVNILPPKNSKINKKVNILPPNNANVCVYCNKNFKRKDNLTKHIKLGRCKKKNDLLIENENLKEQNKFFESLKNDLLNIMNKQCKIHPKTLEKICRNNGINLESSNNNIIDVSQNKTINNTIVIQLGKEDISKLLSKKEQINILNHGYNSINELIKYIHFNDEFPQFKNIAITNISNKYAYKIDEKLNKMIMCNKEDLIKELIEYRTYDIEEFYSEYEKYIDESKKKAINKLIDNMMEEEGNNYLLKKEEIKILVYNKSEEN